MSLLYNILYMWHWSARSLSMRCQRSLPVEYFCAKSKAACAKPLTSAAFNPRSWGKSWCGLLASATKCFNSNDEICLPWPHLADSGMSKDAISWHATVRLLCLSSIYTMWKKRLAKECDVVPRSTQCNQSRWKWNGVHPMMLLIGWSLAGDAGSEDHHGAVSLKLNQLFPFLSPLQRWQHLLGSWFAQCGILRSSCK